MSEPNVLVNFRLDTDRPMRLRWLATNGVPGAYHGPDRAVGRTIGGPG